MLVVRLCLEVVIAVTLLVRESSIRTFLMDTGVVVMVVVLCLLRDNTKIILTKSLSNYNQNKYS